MNPVIPVFHPNDAITDMTSALDEAGCLVVTEIMDNQMREGIRQELQPHLDATPYAENDQEGDFYPGRTKRFTALIDRSAGVRALTVHPVTTALCDHHLLPNCEKYNVHVTAALEVGPGARAQQLHREEDPFEFFALPRPNLVIASMAAMTDFTADNGGTLLVPGSHRWDKERQATPDEVLAAEMPAGSMLFWLGGTLHAAGANVTDTWRYGIILSYSLGWLRQEENQYMDVSNEVLANLSEEERDRIGLTMHGSLGLYDPRVRQIDLPPALPKNLQ